MERGQKVLDQARADLASLGPERFARMYGAQGWTDDEMRGVLAKVFGKTDEAAHGPGRDIDPGIIKYEPGQQIKPDWEAIRQEIPNCQVPRGGEYGLTPVERLPWKVPTRPPVPEILINKLSPQETEDIGRIGISAWTAKRLEDLKRQGRLQELSEREQESWDGPAVARWSPADEAAVEKWALPKASPKLAPPAVAPAPSHYTRLAGQIVKGRCRTASGSIRRTGCGWRMWWGRIRRGRGWGSSLRAILGAIRGRGRWYRI